MGGKKHPGAGFHHHWFCFGLLVLIGFMFFPANARPDKSPFDSGIALKEIRVGQHSAYDRLVFEFDGPFEVEEITRHHQTVFVRFRNVKTHLTPFHKYQDIQSWVRLEKQSRGLDAAIGIPGHFLRLEHFVIDDPDRMVIDLYKKGSAAGKAAETTGSTSDPKTPGRQKSVRENTKEGPFSSDVLSPENPDTTSDSDGTVAERKQTPGIPASGSAVEVIDMSVAVDQKSADGSSTIPQTDDSEASLTDETMLIGSTAVDRKAADPDNVSSRQHPDEDIAVNENSQNLVNLNFIDVDIRELFSALAMQSGINVLIAEDVTGAVSIHLNQMSAEDALRAVSLAGGYRCLETDGLFYIFKPDEPENPESDRLEVKVFELKYADVDKIQDIMDAFPDKRMIKVHEPSKTVIVEDTPENIKKVERIIAYWDKKPRQVIIEAKILDVTLTDDMSFGVDWEEILIDFLNSNIRFGTGGFSTGVVATPEGVSPIPATGTGFFGNLITGVGKDEQFRMALDALQTKTKVDIIATPKILAVHGKSARVQVGGEEGYRVTTVTGTGIATESIEFIDTGVILEITPFIDDDGTILLNVKPSINSVTLQEGGIPSVRRTEVTTWLMARDGETAFIGGLIQSTKIRSQEMIPCLGSMPVIGPGFGTTSSGIGKTELVVLITPHLSEGHLKEAGEKGKKKVEEIEGMFEQEPKSPLKRLYEK